MNNNDYFRRKHPDDPHELKNLAGDPKYGAVVAEMKKLLKGMP